MFWWGDHLGTLSHEPYDGVQGDLRLLREMVSLERLLSLCRDRRLLGISSICLPVFAALDRISALLLVISIFVKMNG